ncbi:hypothetical protein [Aliikangiella sp. G2MR2-5]|uniref:hypothetical protein n=1 Tax=Aliikangiella sp. G2MR2-5 TaxID=2788943 RepID=UPI0018A91FA7|nr:hypothetical protein [Aliikangiella sp. G2MR2-5]
MNKFIVLLFIIILFGCSSSTKEESKFQHKSTWTFTNPKGKKQLITVEYNKTEYNSYSDIPKKYKSDLTEKFSSLVKSMTREEVRSIMGKPHAERSLADIWFLNGLGNYRSQLWVSYDFSGEITITALWQDGDTGVYYRPYQ